MGTSETAPPLFNASVRYQDALHVVRGIDHAMYSPDPTSIDSDRSNYSFFFGKSDHDYWTEYIYEFD